MCQKDCYSIPSDLPISPPDHHGHPCDVADEDVTYDEAYLLVEPHMVPSTVPLPPGISLALFPSDPGAHFTKDFWLAIHIQWKFQLAVIPLLAIRSQQFFAHATTAQLSCHMQNFVAITLLHLR